MLNSIDKVNTNYLHASSLFSKCTRGFDEGLREIYGYINLYFKNI